MAKELIIILGCDTDPDRESFVGRIPANTLTWRGMLEGIPRAKVRLAPLVDSDGKPPVFSWCLRVDHQVAAIHGMYNWVLKTYKEFLLGLEGAGDELSWHPHFWKYDLEHKCWYQEYWDRRFQVDMLKSAYAAYQEVLPGRAKTVRMGWGYHNTETYATMDALGLEVEYSAIPGLRLSPANEKVRSSNFFDWSLSPDYPYYPAVMDYRREAQPDEKSFSLVEVPVFVSHSVFWGLAAGAQLARKMKDLSQLTHAVTRPTYLINITGKPNLFRPMLAQLHRALSSRDRVIFNIYLHADELIENQHPLYKLEYMETNIAAMLAVARQQRAVVRYIRAQDVRRYL